MESTSQSSRAAEFTYRDRHHAGVVLARELHRYAERRPLVVAIAYGGVPVGVAVAQGLACELDVMIVHKLEIPELGALPPGLFGASTGAAAAMIVASERPRRVVAVVSRGGRPDLAEHALAGVQAPTLLIVGADDRAVLELNRAAAERLRSLERLEVVAGATHLFAEPGSLESVAELATRFLGSGCRFPAARTAQEG